MAPGRVAVLAVVLAVLVLAAAALGGADRAGGGRGGSLDAAAPARALVTVGAYEALESRGVDPARVFRHVEVVGLEELASRGGLEGALVQGPWSLQAEYMQARVQRTSGPDLAFDGWYAFASWFVTGEHRRYNHKRGSFKQIRPKGRYGAWELAARYSSIDLADQNVQGGQEDNITLGVNWYVNKNLRFMANYILVNADPNRYGDQDEPRILQFRGQYHF